MRVTRVSRGANGTLVVGFTAEERDILLKGQIASIEHPVEGQLVFHMHGESDASLASALHSIGFEPMPDDAPVDPGLVQ